MSNPKKLDTCVIEQNKVLMYFDFVVFPYENLSNEYWGRGFLRFNIHELDNYNINVKINNDSINIAGINSNGLEKVLFLKCKAKKIQDNEYMGTVLLSVLDNTLTKYQINNVAITLKPFLAFKR